MSTVKGGNSSGPSNVGIETIGGEDIQLVKATFGVASTLTRVSTTNPMPVQPYIDPTTQVWKHFSATSTAVGHLIWDPAPGKKIAVSSLQMGSTGTVPSDFTLWFGAAADTTYTEGTDQVLSDGTFVPGASAAPGLVFTPHVPVFATTADHKLRLSMPSNMQLKVTVYGYEV